MKPLPPLPPVSQYRKTFPTMSEDESKRRIASGNEARAEMLRLERLEYEQQIENLQHLSV
jgi:hypothetical protein